jgi:small subunit ribosomal protein S17
MSKSETVRKTAKVGTVTSSAMDKTVVVRVDSVVLDPLYQRFVQRSRKFMAHDESNACKVGDKVQIVETRPLSRRKRWRVTQVLEQAR